MLKAEFSFEDFLKIQKQIKALGSFGGILSMLPLGISKDEKTEPTNYLPLHEYNESVLSWTIKFDGASNSVDSNEYHAKVLNDYNVVEMYNEIVGNNILQQFDTDTVETSSIVDNYEISSGGIYIPDNDVLTSTIEGCNLANAKNDYLIQRLHLGQDASNDDVMKIINEYYKNIQYDKVNEYFNKGN